MNLTAIAQIVQALANIKQGPLGQFANGSIPMMTGVDPEKEGNYQAFMKTHPDIYAGPTRDQQGNLIPDSLYDMRGAVYAGDNGAVNAQDLQPHYSDLYKLPGYQQQQQNIGNSVFSDQSALSRLMPQNAGSWHGDDQGGWYPAQPIQQINPNTFYPAWFGQGGTR